MYLARSQIWLQLSMDHHHFGYITKFTTKKKKKKKNTGILNIPHPLNGCI
jgi:hypothetical protein